MNLNSTDEKHQIFENNVKKEPEEEFLCILPSFDTENAHEGNLMEIKQEKEIQSEKILKLQCKTCLKVFRSTSNLKKHEKVHQKQHCKVCNRKVLQKSFEKHMKSHQNEKTERKFECKICFQKFMTKIQRNHHVLYHSKRFQCDLCGLYSASTKHVLMVHLNLHLVQGQYKCVFCRKLFDDRESFRFHSRQAHGDPKNRTGLTKADLSCGTCGKEFGDVSLRKSHERSHEEKIQCPICDKKILPVFLAKHVKLHELSKKGDKFICDICGKEKSTKYTLKYHLEIHLSLDKIECNICRKTFTHAIALKTHSKTIHNLNVDPSKLSCNVCQVNCRNLSALNSHKLIHEVSKTCPICSKPIKPRCFPEHIKLHELKKEEKKFQCKVCRKKFYSYSNLHNHMGTHSVSLECDLCEYQTGRKENIKYHMVNHMKLEPVECQICKRTYKTAKRLNFHIFRNHKTSR